MGPQALAAGKEDSKSGVSLTRLLWVCGKGQTRPEQQQWRVQFPSQSQQQP